MSLGTILRPVEEPGGWLVVQPTPDAGATRGRLGAPGLWRDVGDGPVFEIPPAAREAVVDLDLDEPLEDPDRDLLSWAADTVGGAFRGDVVWPDPAELDLYVPRAQRAVRAGAHVSGVEIVAGPSRVALVVPSLVEIPRDLSESRLAWLEAVCADARRRWRLVRFGVETATGDRPGRVCAEVDLTGAPPERAHVLFPLALAALTESASRVLPALALVTDPECTSRILDGAHRHTSPQPTNEEGESR